ncbi:MAG: protein-L-isoaspartate O-methyltransferase [Pseudomonadota bacterium]
MDIEQARFNMIEQQIRPWDVLDIDVLRVIEDTPRELFVPAKHKKLAFSDLEIPLTHDQNMMAPKIEARMLQALSIQPGDDILEIGTGSGFVTACLAKLGKHVDTIEYHEDLSEQAARNLSQQQLHNISHDVKDILNNPFSGKLYDAIAVTASMPVYNSMFEQYLKENGRLFVIAGNAPVMQAKLIRHVGKHGNTETNLFETNLLPLIGIDTPNTFTL